MTTIIDRRNQGKSPSAANRKKFLDRYKKYVKESVDKTLERSKIKDIKKKRRITVPVDRIDEPKYIYDPKKGVNRQVGTGNKTMSKGDTRDKPRTGEGGYGGAGNSSKPDEFDESEFELSKSEFLDILFEDMKLPNNVKESLKQDLKEKRVRAGYSSDGVISQLNLKKTFQQSFARRLVHKGSRKRRIEEALTEQEKEELKKKKIPFLEDVDLRYNVYRTIQYPVKQAVMFCLMDVSGSMGQHHKDLAKRFFILLYLFLEQEYDSVDIIFIRHTEEAREVDEDAFFNDKDTGGTVVSTCYDLMLDIIDKHYDPAIYNIYGAHASDGDNWGEDSTHLVTLLEDEVLPIVQYLAYVEVYDKGHNLDQMTFNPIMPPLSIVYVSLVEKYKHFNQVRAGDKDQVFSALRGLFIDD